MISNEEIFNNRAKVLAKETKMEIIDMEIEDWAKECNELSLRVSSLKVELDTANTRRELWLKAKRIKEGTS